MMHRGVLMLTSGARAARDALAAVVQARHVKPRDVWSQTREPVCPEERGTAGC